MQKFNAGVRSKNIFNPESKEPFKLSRSKLELFIECPRCFYLDRRLGVSRPGGFPFTLNNAVDTLLKKEFDIHRAKNSAHPLMRVYGIDAVPFAHDDLGDWRENFKGIQFYHRPTNLVITGALDDVWINPAQELIVVDYKATSTTREIDMSAEYRQGYKRQVEIYQWLLRQNGFKVSNTAYFVYANGDTDKTAFDAKLEFKIQIFPHEGNDGWVEPVIFEAHKCLLGEAPPPSKTCEFCLYREAVKNQGF